MSAHTKEQFDMFMSQLKETNTTLGFYCDFEKINNNVESISIKLNQLNYLIGQVDMDAAIRRLWDENRNVFSILEILIAVRTTDKKKAIMADGNVKLIVLMESLNIYMVRVLMKCLEISKSRILLTMYLVLKQV